MTTLQENALNPMSIIIIIGLLGLLPFFLTMVTSYVKIIVVAFILRNALGIQQTPPNMVLTGLAMMLSVFIMAPVASQTYDLAQKISEPQEFTFTTVVDTASQISDPLKSFLTVNTEEKILKTFTNSAKKIWPQEMQSSVADDSFLFLIPSFVISELTKAFQIGFLLYLPFIVIDLIISNILLAMGMMMVSPMAISLPFKLMLFVTLDGWLKLSQGLLYSYGY